MVEMEQQLRNFILGELAHGGQRRLALDEPLFESVLDSTSVLALVAFLERQYGLEIPDVDVVPANFSTLRRIVAYIEARRIRSLQPRLAASAV